MQRRKTRIRHAATYHLGETWSSTLRAARGRLRDISVLLQNSSTPMSVKLTNELVASNSEKSPQVATSSIELTYGEFNGGEECRARRLHHCH